MECGGMHSFEDDARECCPPEVREVFVCLDCGDWHQEKAEAESCCTDGPGEQQAQAPIPSTAQLEALGQLRLVP
jgi:hypothetical protein